MIFESFHFCTIKLEILGVSQGSLSHRSNIFDGNITEQLHLTTTQINKSRFLIKLFIEWYIQETPNSPDSTLLDNAFE